MEKPRKTIQKSVTVGCILSVLLLCVLLSVPCYLLFSSALYRQYDARLGNVLSYVEHRTDADDLRQCIRSGQPSESYRLLEKLLEDVADDFDLYFLYIVIPAEERGVMVNVVSATNTAQRGGEKIEIPMLAESEAYAPKMLHKYAAVWDSRETCYFEESSDYGACYTGCRALRASDGETVALICADVSIASLHRIIRSYFLITVLIAAAVGAAACLLILRWLRRNVTGPIVALEQSARRFAESSHERRDLPFPDFEMPDLRADNELASLAEAVAKMSEDMEDYVANVLHAEARAKSAEEEAEDMSRIAYQDSLTHVKSKAAYRLAEEELSAAVAAGKAEFAIVMVDLNFLKLTNDTYGHEYGDRYLIGTCMVICQVYKHSPVYRFGGDEFVVVLRGQDYVNRDALLAELKRQYAETSGNPEFQPWERYSAAAGMGVYTAGETVEQVFKRADDEMYRNKDEMKAGR